ncbi:MAG TPA: hypothetical protein VNZ52_07120, partial [Candidatus Thermoplasmatota archaeon]|nr:hypothetical protein [Candidatus Thermoplasmatota archaeon]
PAVFSGNLTLEVAPSGDADAMQGKRASRLQIEPASSGQGVEQITMRGHSLGGIVAIDLVQGRLQVGPGGVAHLMGEAVQAISADRALLGCRLQVLDPPVSVEARAGERAHLVLQVVVSGEGSAVNPTVRVLELTTPVGLLPGPAMATPPTNVTDTRRGDGGLEGWVPGTTVWFPLTLQAPARAIPAGAMTLVVEAENCRSEAVVIAVAPSSP